MSKIWDEREKSLEEEYFRRKEQESIHNLHEKRAEEERRKLEEASAIHCPKCGGKLVQMLYEDVQVDRCSKCNGIWLDAGELERLTTREESWLTRLWRSLFGK